jgi:Flp pilus assembly protein TadD
MNRKDRRAQQAGKGSANPSGTRPLGRTGGASAADPVFALAVQHASAGRLPEAQALAEGVLRASPQHPDALHLLGVIAHQQARFETAAELIGRALALRPDMVDARINRGLALTLLGRYSEAEKEVALALARQPGNGQALKLQALILRDCGRLDEAAIAFAGITRRDPRDFESWSNLGATLRALDRFPEAETAFRKAIAIRPDMPAAHSNLGKLLLVTGRLRDGFAEDEWRWRTLERRQDIRPFRQPMWEGQDLAGKTLLLWSEQGPGDQILAASMIPDLLQRGARLVIECKKRMAPVFARAFPAATVIDVADPPHPAALSADIAFQSPLGNIGRWLRPDLAAFPKNPGFLKADRQRSELIRARYRADGAGPVVGIAWRSKNAAIGVQKSIALPAWKPILTTPGITWINLQYGDVAEEVSAVERDFAVVVRQDPDIDQLADMDALVAQVAALDLVITTSQTVAHVAGALGVPVWILLPRGDGLLWYWFVDGERSPFYASARLFRQAAGGGWTAMLEDVAARLAQFPNKGAGES